MEMNDILTLAKAGFTANQIAALNALSQQPTVPPNQQQVMPLNQQQTMPLNQQQTMPLNQQTATNPFVPLNNDPLANMASQIQQLTNTLQAGNIMGSQMTKPETTDDILANIINPPSVVSPGNNK